MHCDVLIENTGAEPSLVAGLTPANFQARYNLPSSKDGAGQVVALVDSYDNPDAASDLAAYPQELRPGERQSSPNITS